jgi:hypothetical protein
VIGPDPYSFGELWRQYRRCRRNKRNTMNALAFEIDAEAHLLELQRELRDHTYAPGRSVCFVTDGPKPREVFAADFRDRIVHHLLVSWQEPLFERRFIHDSYACRKGKGTLAASDRLMGFMRKATANGRRPAWALGLDVASFFPSIQKRILYEILARAFRNPEVLWLTRTVLFHDPTEDYVFRARGRGRGGRPGDARYPVEARKSLFGNRGELDLAESPVSGGRSETRGSPSRSSASSERCRRRRDSHQPQGSRSSSTSRRWRRRRPRHPGRRPQRAGRE